MVPKQESHDRPATRKPTTAHRGTTERQAHQQIHTQCRTHAHACKHRGAHAHASNAERWAGSNPAIDGQGKQRRQRKQARTTAGRSLSNHRIGHACPSHNRPKAYINREQGSLAVSPHENLPYALFVPHWTYHICQHFSLTNHHQARAVGAAPPTI